MFDKQKRKAEMREEAQVSNGAYRSSIIKFGKMIPGFRLWLYKRLAT
ncbi:hypothetical protein KKB41_03705 [Patescibacteria group bacterium]|nr:hypothetical protein [Patescibacteria group bacterium]